MFDVGGKGTQRGRLAARAIEFATLGSFAQQAAARRMRASN
jgi:hypothetical protein